MFQVIVAGVLIITAVSYALITNKIKNNKQVKKSKNQIKGEIGEKQTADIFGKFFENNSINFKVLRNVYLQFNDENTTEIDIIFITEYGIFVIENKNYRGWIFGSFKDKYWTDCYPSGTKIKFYNPLKQNYIHIKTLMKYIDNKYNDKIYSYVIFNNECELKKVPYNSEFIKVIREQDILITLSDCLKEKFITSDEIQAIYNCLCQFSDVSDEIKKMHIKTIENKKEAVKK